MKRNSEMRRERIITMNRNSIQIVINCDGDAYVSPMYEPQEEQLAMMTDLEEDNQNYMSEEVDLESVYTEIESLTIERDEAIERAIKYEDQVCRLFEELDLKQKQIQQLQKQI